MFCCQIVGTNYINLVYSFTSNTPRQHFFRDVLLQSFKFHFSINFTGVLMVSIDVLTFCISISLQPLPILASNCLYPITFLFFSQLTCSCSFIYLPWGRECAYIAKPGTWNAKDTPSPPVCPIYLSFFAGSSNLSGRRFKYFRYPLNSIGSALCREFS